MLLNLVVEKVGVVPFQEHIWKSQQDDAGEDNIDEQLWLSPGYCVNK